MTEAENIASLIELNPDFIGYIFHQQSPRNIKTIPKVIIPKNIKKVGVFVNKPLEFILEKATLYSLDFIQLHGNETAEFCKKIKQHKFKIIKAFNISNQFDFEQLNKFQTTCDYFLFDAFGKNAGGNGITFNWDLLQQYYGKTSFLLSGGIDTNLIDQIKQLKHPKFIGIDINSKFEIIPGFKNIKKIKQFKDELQS